MDHPLPTLFVHSIRYSGSHPAVVAMRTGENEFYFFQELEDGLYLAMHQDRSQPHTRMMPLTREELPPVLRTIFEARTIDNILQLQADRKLAEFIHYRK